jgi:hypothetical protein
MLPICSIGGNCVVSSLGVYAVLLINGFDQSKARSLGRGRESYNMADVICKSYRRVPANLY